MIDGGDLLILKLRVGAGGGGWGGEMLLCN